jgi:hypothetical protein
MKPRVFVMGFPGAGHIGTLDDLNAGAGWLISRHLSRPVAQGRLPDLPGNYAPTFTLASRIYATVFRTCIGLCILWPAHPTVPPLSASCSSRQRFASGFLPTLSHPRRRCPPLTLAHVGCVEDFHLRVRCALPGAPKPGGLMLEIAEALTPRVRGMFEQVARESIDWDGSDPVRKFD